LQKLWILLNIEEDAKYTSDVMSRGHGNWKPVETVGLDDEEFEKWNKQLKLEAQAQQKAKESG